VAEEFADRGGEFRALGRSRQRGTDLGRRRHHLPPPARGFAGSKRIRLATRSGPSRASWSPMQQLEECPTQWARDAEAAQQLAAPVGVSGDAGRLGWGRAVVVARPDRSSAGCSNRGANHALKTPAWARQGLLEGVLSLASSDPEDPAQREQQHRKDEVGALADPHRRLRRLVELSCETLARVSPVPRRSPGRGGRPPFAAGLYARMLRARLQIQAGNLQTYLGASLQRG
jgi:hypothetical protein